MERPVIVCTEYRGVFYGYAEETTGDVIKLKRAKMAIYWGTTRGILELAHSGPTAKSRISLPADLEVRKVTCVMEVTPQAQEKWDAA